MSERAQAFGQTEGDERVVVGDENSHLAGAGKTTSARVPPPGSACELESPMQTLLDHATNELQPEPGGPIEAVASVVDAQARLRARGQSHDERGLAVLEGVRDQLVRDDSEFLGGRSVERTGAASTTTGTGAPSAMLRRSAPRIDVIFGLGQQPVHGRDRADARGRVVERLTVAAVRAAEQEQVGHGLEVVLDPVARFFRERALEVCACGSSSVRRRLAANRPHEDERHSDRGCEQSEPHRRRAGRERDERCDDQAGPGTDGKPEPAAPTHLHDRDERNGEEEEQREARAARNDEQRNEPDQSS